MDSQNAMCSETLVSFVKSFYVSWNKYKYKIDLT
jgi:hypothetical protein